MKLNDMVLVSVDDHVVEPPHLFEGRLPAKYADLAPQFVTRADGTNAWVYEGAEIANVALNEGPQIPAAVGLSGYEDARAHEADSADDHARLKQLPQAVGEREIVDDDDRVAVTRQRGQQLKDVAQLDGWADDGSLAHVRSLCDFAR